MLTARYLIDIVSGIIEDLSSLIEAESMLLESLFYNNYLISRDDINIVKKVNPELIYLGLSMRYISEDRVMSKRWARDTDRCFLWSKSVDTLSKFRNQSDYVIVSEVEGLDLFNVSTQVLNKTKKIKNETIDNYKEFQRLKRDSKRLGLIIAPLGNETSLELTSDLRSLGI